MTTPIKEAIGNPATVGTVPAHRDRRGRQLEAFVLAAAFVFVNLASMALQKSFYFHDDQGWEGVAYLSMARQAAAGRWPIRADAPEVYRLGGPYLAGLVQRATGRDLLVCFKLVNGTANALTLVLLVAWLRRFLADWRVRTALGLAFLLQWDTPTRWMYFFPPHTDPWMWVFLLAGLIAADRCRARPTPGRIALVAALTVVGVCFREIVMVIPLLLAFTGNPLRAGNLRERWREALPRLGPLAAGLLAMAALRLVARKDNDYTFAWTAAHWLYDKPWPTYVQSWFAAFGPILWLAIFRARDAGGFLARHQGLAVYLLAFAALADVGGSDTERFLFWTMPVVYVLIGRALEEARGAWPGGLLAVLAGAQLVASRAVFWPIPDYPNDVPHAWPLLTPLGRSVPFDDLYSTTEPRLLSLAVLVEYLAFGAALGIWLRWRRTRTGPRPAARQMPS